MEKERCDLEQKYKVKSSEIKYLNDVADVRNNHIKNIHKQAILVNNIV